MTRQLKWAVLIATVAVVAFLVGWKLYPGWNPLGRVPASALVIIVILLVALGQRRRSTS